MKLMRRLGAIFDGALNITAFVSGLLLIILMLLVCIAVVLRYFFKSPLGWSTEVSQYIFVFMGNLVIAWVLRREKHVKVDVLVNSLNQNAQGLVNIITSAACTVTGFILTLFAVRVTLDLYRTHYFEPTILMLPKSIFIASIAFGCLMLSIQFMRRTYGYMKSWSSHRHEEDDRS
jgi:TRAP-type C4-dicarboxylate transport system permease small subunit